MVLTAWFPPVGQHYKVNHQRTLSQVGTRPDMYMKSFCMKQEGESLVPASNGYLYPSKVGEVGENVKGTIWRR